MTKNGPKGETIVLMRKIVTKAGHTAKFENIPWSRSLRMVKNGEVDGMMSLYRTPERAKDLIFSKHPLAYTKDLIISATHSNVPSIYDYDNLFKYTVGVLQDNSYGKRFDDLKLTKDYSCSTENHIIKKLLEDRFELAVITEKPLFYYLKKMKISSKRITVHPLVIAEEGLHYALSTKIKNANSIMNSLNVAHESLIHQQ